MDDESNEGGPVTNLVAAFFQLALNLVKFAVMLLLFRITIGIFVILMHSLK